MSIDAGERILATKRENQKNWAGVSFPPTRYLPFSSNESETTRSPRLNSEVELQAELQLTGRVCRARNRSEFVAIAYVYIRNAPHRSICQIERLEPEFESFALRDWELLEQREIEVLEPVRPQSIAAQIAKRTGSRN